MTIYSRSCMLLAGLFLGSVGGLYAAPTTQHDLAKSALSIVALLQSMGESDFLSVKMLETWEKNPKSAGHTLNILQNLQKSGRQDLITAHTLLQFCRAYENLSGVDKVIEQLSLSARSSALDEQSLFALCLSAPYSEHIAAIIQTMIQARQYEALTSDTLIFLSLLDHHLPELEVFCRRSVEQGQYQLITLPAMEEFLMVKQAADYQKHRTASETVKKPLTSNNWKAVAAQSPSGGKQILAIYQTLKDRGHQKILSVQSLRALWEMGPDLFWVNELVQLLEKCHKLNALNDKNFRQACHLATDARWLFSCVQQVAWSDYDSALNQDMITQLCQEQDALEHIAYALNYAGEHTGQAPLNKENITEFLQKVGVQKRLLDFVSELRQAGKVSAADHLNFEELMQFTPEQQRALQQIVAQMNESGRSDLITSENLKMMVEHPENLTKVAIIMSYLLITQHPELITQQTLDGLCRTSKSLQQLEAFFQKIIAEEKAGQLTQEQLSELLSS